MSKKMCKSVRKFIRREKARIRRQILDTKKQEEAIKAMYAKLSEKPVQAKEPKKEAPKVEKPVKNKKQKV